MQHGRDAAGQHATGSASDTVFSYCGSDSFKHFLKGQVARKDDIGLICVDVMLINITMIPRIKNIALNLFLKTCRVMQISRTHPNTVTSLPESQVQYRFLC